MSMKRPLGRHYKKRKPVTRVRFIVRRVLAAASAVLLLLGVIGKVSARPKPNVAIWGAAKSPSKLPEAIVSPVAWMDPHLLAFQQVSGTKLPEGNFSHGNGRVLTKLRSFYMAGFADGYRMKDSQGGTGSGKNFIWRSAIGLRADGTVVYVQSQALSAGSLANLLVRAGAVRGMALDMNKAFANGDLYGPYGPKGKAINPDNQNPTDRFYKSSTRDFVAVFAKSPRIG